MPLDIFSLSRLKAAIEEKVNSEIPGPEVLLPVVLLLSSEKQLCKFRLLFGLLQRNSRDLFVWTGCMKAIN